VTIRDHLLATGIRRLGGPHNGFRYRRADGRRATAADLRRIAALSLPAPWTDVRIARSPREPVQAVGRDAAGRWQYRYLESRVRRRSHAKFDRLLAFGSALPRLRRALARDLARPGLPREKALACAVSLLLAVFLRPGTDVYAEQNGTFGLATLRDRHVRVDGDCIRFDFRGKRAQRQQSELRDARLARLVAAMQRLPGAELLQFVDARGRVRDVKRAHLDRYIKRAMGSAFSARAFRTWGGTLLFAGALARVARGGQRTGSGGIAARHAAVADALRTTAAQLGNTVEACRRAYVHPGVLREFARGRTVSAPLARVEALIAHGRAGFDRSERALLALLRRDRAARSPAAARIK
jgi:DNA topoisomerase-1